MIIAPNDHWRWSYDHQADRLMLDLSDQMVFASEYRGKQLVPAAFVSAPFCVEDAALFYNFLDKIQELDWCAPEKVQLVLNAIAVKRFYKPLMPQSWFFAEQPVSLTVTQGDLVWMDCQSHGHSALFVVVEEGEQASVCLHLDQEFLLCGGKPLSRFAVIKVMNNRLRRWLPPVVSLQQAV
jgi:cell division protein ZapC